MNFSVLQFPRDRSKYPGPDGLILRIQQHRRVLIKADDRSVRSANTLTGTNNYRIHHLTFLAPGPGESLPLP